MTRAHFSAFAACVALLLCALPRARAEDVGLNAQDPGLGEGALPGVRKLGLATAFDEGLAAAAGLSYGYTESVERLRDAHHRLRLDAAGSYTLTETVAVGGAIAGRYDAHVGGATPGDSNALLASRLHARARAALADDFMLGGELAIVLPGAEGADRFLDSMTPELRALGSYTGLHPKLVLGAQLGVRVDRSAKGIGDHHLLAGADRIALGASDSNALLLGVGGTFSVSPTLLVLGELGWDLLVGSRAPGALDSPMRITGGVRYALTRMLALDGFLTVSPSGRPHVGRLDALAPIEPRFAIGLGLSMRLARLAPPPSVLAGHVVDELGEPIANARITAVDAAQKRTLTAITDAHGAFTLTFTEGARLMLRAEAEQRVPGQLQVTLRGPRFDLGDWSLPRGRGALVGRVFGPDGLPNAGAVVSAYALTDGAAGSAPPIAETRTSADGRFALRDLPAGAVQLSARAVGFRDAQALAAVPVGAEQAVDLALAEALPEGQIRGTVRGTGGAPLPATVRIDPLGLVLTAERDGTFSVDVAPGRYEVLVTAPGYEPQQRSADVERDGVTVLAIDLVRQP